jgi:flagellar biosynthesis protein FliP
LELSTTDAEEQKHWYSHTEFGKKWRWLTEKNAMLTNICVNGGILAMITSFLRLQSHRRAEVLEASKTESKKTK